MPKLNKGFSKSKMNKDFDERIVPAGEYRDALNIQISTTDDSDVGSAQTVMGNVLISSGMVPDGSHCVGSIASDKEDKVYYLVAGPRFIPSTMNYINGCWKDYIIEYDVKTETLKYVFVDIYRAHLTTTATSSGRTQFVDTSTIPISSVRKDMLVNGYDSANNHIDILTSDDAEQVMITATSAISSTIDINSSSTNFNNTPVPANVLFQCTSPRLLYFDKDRKITGINIIDGMLFWTDNYYEPKKINIERSIAGTGGTTELPAGIASNPASQPMIFTGDNSDWHTRLCITPDKHNKLRVKRRGPLNKASEWGAWFTKEENITVIKKAPKTPPRLEMERHEERTGITFSATDGTAQHISGPPSASGNSFSEAIGSTSYIKNPGDSITNVMVSNPVNWKLGDMILFNQQQDVNSPEGFTEHDVRATVTSVGSSPVSTGPFSFTIQSIDREAIDEEQKIWNLRLEERKPMFEFKFVRFAYRYKYEDGEYSTFSPWSEPAFLPGEYDFLPVKGYNLGMTNRLRQLTITNYITEESERPQDVIQVDLLYKDESSPNIYTVESIKMTDGWTRKGEYLWPDIINNGDNITDSDRERGRYEVTSELIHAAVPSNQLLRQWDNVPRKALAQTISGNRLIYGNYVQNFDLTHPRANKEIKPIINVTLQAYDAPLNAPDGTSPDPLNGLDTLEGFAKPGKTCRSLREYQVGVVYGDEYGRETPVLIGEAGTGSLTIEKENSSTLNQLRVDIATEAPAFAKYYKYFIKETSNEYYNMAMDRWYDAEDGNIWLSFASSDRNKVDIETSIILKKKHDTHEPVTDPARYKILAIEDSAPPFIATNSKTLGKVTDGAGGTVGSSTTGFPLENYQEIRIDEGCTGFDEIYESGDAAGATDIQSKVHNGTLWMRARKGQIRSDWYQVSNYIPGDGSNNIQHKFKSDKQFGQDMAFTSSDGTWSGRISGIQIEFADRKIERKKEFEGRFFVKIYKDLVLINNLLEAKKPVYKVIDASRIHYFNMPQGRSDNISTFLSTNMTNWERCAVNNEGDLADATLTGSSQWGINCAAGSEDDGELFFRTARNGYKQGAGFGNAVAGVTGTRNWCENSTGILHFDAMFVRGARACNGKVTASDRRCLDKDCDDFTGCSRGLGITNDGKSMDIGYISKNEWQWYDPEHKDFMDVLVTTGTMFRFREDPDGHVYTVTGRKFESDWQSPEGARYGQHHTYHEASNGSTGTIGNWGSNGNNKWRWRIDFERVDLPGVGLPTNPDSINYHPLGGKATTAITGVEELGYWGGRNANNLTSISANQHWQVNINDPRHPGGDLYVPAPPGYNSLPSGNPLGQINLGDSTQTNDYGDSVDGVTQACRWREHASKFHHIEIVVPIEDEDSDWSSKNPAMWETEPKEDIGMDIYYEASPALPIKIDYRTNEMFAPYGSLLVKGDGTQGGDIPVGTKIQSWSGNKVTLTNVIDLSSPSYQGGSRFGFKRPDGFISYAITNEFGAMTNQLTLRASNHYPPHPTNNNYSDAPHNQPATLSWYNAFAFGNGIESDRIRDDFNQKTIENGVKASTVLAEQYSEDRRKTGLISSGIYNSSSNINRLNQFIQAEKITKDLNPLYGSIQKLHARETNVVALCEDKCVKILADKNILFNADGTGNVSKSGNFFGDAVEFATNYGISTNPESFATDLSGRMYFSDRARGAVLRLSGDGITNISNYGMKKWFNDHLNPSTESIIGSFDTKKGLYNISISGYVETTIDNSSNNGSNGQIEGGCSCDGENGNGNGSGPGKPGGGGPDPDPRPGGPGPSGSGYGGQTGGGASFGSTIVDPRSDFDPDPHDPDPHGPSSARQRDGSDRKICFKCNHETGTVDFFSPVRPEDGCKNVSYNYENNTIWNTPDQQGGWADSNGNTTYQELCLDTQSQTDISTKFIEFNKTISFSENSKGWISFKSFLPESGVSINNNYYTFKRGNMYKHHANSRNVFYGVQYDSSIDVIFNDSPEVVKSFATLNYEGTQARTTSDFKDNEYFNLNTKDGWYVSDVITDLQTCANLEFKNKEGKWFTHIKGNTTALANLDEQEFSVQGIGAMAAVNWDDDRDEVIEPSLECLNISPLIECGEIYGCTDIDASNYNPNATLEDGSCVYPPISGCIDDTLGANPDIYGNDVLGDPCSYPCTYGFSAINYNPNAVISDGSCDYDVLGCTDPTASNYDPNATVDDGSCKCPTCPRSGSRPFDHIHTKLELGGANLDYHPDHPLYGSGISYWLATSATEGGLVTSAPGASDGAFAVHVKHLCGFGPYGPYANAWNPDPNNFVSYITLDPRDPPWNLTITDQDGNICSPGMPGIGLINAPTCEPCCIGAWQMSQHPMPNVPLLYNWNNTYYGQYDSWSFAIAGLSQGCYTVQITDMSGCHVKSTVCITDPPDSMPCDSGWGTDDVVEDVIQVPWFGIFTPGYNASALHMLYWDTPFGQPCFDAFNGPNSSCTPNGYSNPSEILMSHLSFGYEFEDGGTLSGYRKWIYLGWDPVNGQEHYERMDYWELIVEDRKVYPTALLEWMVQDLGISITYTTFLNGPNPSLSSEGSFSTVTTTKSGSSIQVIKEYTFSAFVNKLNSIRALDNSGVYYDLFKNSAGQQIVVGYVNGLHYSEMMWEIHDDKRKSEVTNAYFDKFIFTSRECCWPTYNPYTLMYEWNLIKDCEGLWAGPDNTYRSATTPPPNPGL